MNWQRGKINAIIMVLVFGLCTCTAGIKAEAAVSGKSLETTGQVVELALHSKNSEVNMPFQMMNMFPGDSKTQYYRLSVSYTGTITVNLHASARSGGEALSEVLEIKVRRADTGEMLYEGTIADMPVLGQELSIDSKSLTEELLYEITVGLSTSVGNEYQNKGLIADLSWWAEGDVPPESGDYPTEPSEPESGDDEESMTGTGGGSLTNPATGDDSRIYMWLAIMCVAVMMMVLVGYRRSMLAASGTTVASAEVTRSGAAKPQSTAGANSRTRLFFGIFLAVLLILGLGITSVALIWQKVNVEDNLFQTGIVSISLNDGETVFQEDMLFEPGMVIKKDFTLRNDSTCDVHYRFYFTNVDGEFAESLQVEVFDGDVAIFEGTLAGMSGRKSKGADGVLKEGEERTMTIIFRVPEDCGNLMQGKTVGFELNADAVQAVNNPDGLFE